MADVMELDAISGKTVTRDMTETETAQRELDKTEIKANAKAVAERATAKQAVLDRLGITADEAALLLG